MPRKLKENKNEKEVKGETEYKKIDLKGNEERSSIEFVHVEKN